MRLEHLVYVRLPEGNQDSASARVKVRFNEEGWIYLGLINYRWGRGQSRFTRLGKLVCPRVNDDQKIYLGDQKLNSGRPHDA